MKQKLDIETWARKDHFQFFSLFDEPFFGITIDVDCSEAYKKCKAEQQSFFLFYLHASLVAANAIEPFRYRIGSENDLFVYDYIHASATVNREDGTFDFSYMPFQSDFDVFQTDAQKEIDRIRAGKGLNPSVAADDVIHYSAIPWLNFTSLSHARSFHFRDSCPKISFGKMTALGEARKIPVAIHVHHALMDGFHVAQFVDAFQTKLNEI